MINYKTKFDQLKHQINEKVQKKYKYNRYKQFFRKRLETGKNYLVIETMMMIK